MRTSPAVDGMKLSGSHPRRDLAGACDPCVAATQTRALIPKSQSTFTAPLKLMHTDVCGSMPCMSSGNAWYFVNVVEDWSDYQEAITIAAKADDGQAVRDVLTNWKTQIGLKLRRSRSDRGAEYVSTIMAKWTARRGAVHETTGLYTP